MMPDHYEIKNTEFINSTKESFEIADKLFLEI